ncbi:polysaccharide deacetylase family protein [Chondrinema litorale]|uniref:polysaccharide deacetylase family protein n=1 Tax=Chondrinema litorale TaxID=2994555 RepID=UPI002542ADB3|nr:polysaccharide deacetylase family protein [Chondrinema litorale]UZR92836.1 polysaccharide deacetylase family protein [Chondrinema litorale]
MMIHKMGWLFQKVLYPTLTWSRYNKDKTIYLTFDDGPIPEMTPEILDLLKTYNAKATFFCVGDNIQKHPEIYQRILKEKHSTGNHTFNHLNGWNTPDTNYFENVNLCNSIIDKYAVKDNCSKLLRPPYGRIKQSQIKQLKAKYEIIMWDVLTGDFAASISPESCLNKAIKYTESGSIVVFHDNLKAKKNLDYALPRYLEHFTQAGYSFKGL